MWFRIIFVVIFVIHRQRASVPPEKEITHEKKIKWYTITPVATTVQHCWYNPDSRPHESANNRLHSILLEHQNCIYLKTNNNNKKSFAKSVIRPCDLWSYVEYAIN